ncbi:MAG: 3-dehydroquinate synthase family protein, partial [Endomicrobiia bacterium]
MNIVNVQTNSKKYKILIGWKILPKLCDVLKKQKISESVFIISTDRIFNIYGEKLISILKNSKITDLGFALIPDGEKSKSWHNYEKLINKIIDFDSGKEKKITVIALGGGVVGDISGFVAGTYKRGVPFVQIPTTLLAMVDSSIGGKTGIDFRHKNKVIKNVLGQFYQPDLVLSDLSFLRTLPKKQLLNGLAEVIKYGIIKDINLFDFLENNTEKILSLEKSAMNYIVKRSSEIKRDIVQQDERETKLIRTILNYGHTIGH